MTTTPTSTELRAAPPFQAYSYAYPHKTAYRPLPRPVALQDVWRDEPKDALFLYLHVPFCEYRCGFCNLFTQAHPQAATMTRYVDALERQAARVQRALGPEARFVRLAIGGGTPTYLEVDALARVFDLTTRLGAVAVPTSIELSPDTATPEKVALLRERGVTRASIGVQSFDEDEARAVSRPQRRAAVEAALGLLSEANFATLNVDLIYGIPGQTRASFLDSLERALAFEPEELYLYPLYVRPLTGLGLGGAGSSAADGLPEGDERLALLRAGRERLLELGWEQVSLRCFRAPHAPETGGPAYCCQDDGMVGLGAGARSYTRALHHSTEWAVGARGVKAIVDDYVARDDAAHDVAVYGFALDEDEQRRRFVIQSLLQREGLDLAAYARRFDGDVFEHLPRVDDLVRQGLATRDAERLVLGPAGLERSDVIGPWLYSENVRRLMEGYALR